MTRPRIRIGVVGLGWMGQAHSRSYARIPMIFPERSFDPVLAVCADSDPARRDTATGSFGFERAVADWRELVEAPDVDVVTICGPNMIHEEIAVAAAAAAKHVFCEKPVGGTPVQTVRIEAAARRAGVITGVGYNYRWAPLVQHTRELIAEGRLGVITNYRGRFFSMYGADPMGLLSWRFQHEGAGYGVSTDILSHSVDLAHLLVGPIRRVMGTMETFITERPLPSGSGTHYDRGKPEDPRGPVTNEDYVGCLVEFENGARGTFEASRTLLGPESQCAFDVYGTRGAAGWDLERMNELRLYLQPDDPSEVDTGYTTVIGGDRFPYHGHFVPGSANGIGFEDLVTIEDYEFLTSVQAGRPHHPGFDDALAFVSVQDALLRSIETGTWADVVSLRED